MKGVKTSPGDKRTHTRVRAHTCIHLGHKLSWLESDHATVPSVAESVADCG